MLNDHLRQEAESFDKRIKERVANGHIPDLRLTKDCDWFYNNPWRRPNHVDKILGDYSRFALSCIQQENSKVLDVGCGPGYFSLELARAGHHVTGIDISDECIRVATEQAEKNPFRDKFGSLSYQVCDLLSFDEGQKFDVICFFMTLHHFDNVEIVIKKIASLLNKNGMLIVIEPMRDRVSKRNAAIIALIRLLLSSKNQWYEKIPYPKNQNELIHYIDTCKVEYEKAVDEGEGEQSPHDNDSFSLEMLDAISHFFDQKCLKEQFAFLPRMIGGIRGTEENIEAMACFLDLVDKAFVQEDILDPTVFLYQGILKKE